MKLPEYALIDLLVLVAAIFLHGRHKVRLFKSRKSLITFYGVMLSVGILWDHFALYRGHWSFGEEFLLGPRIGLMPIEEYAFMIIIIYFAMVVGRIIEKRD